MITRLTAVFVAFLAAAPFSLALAQATAAAAAEPWVTRDASKLRLASANALIFDASADREIYAKGADAVTPIASVTKLMTAMVVLDAKQPEDELIGIDMGDLDLLKGSHSRLRLGTELPRHEMLRLALMASENRAASSLARHYPGGSGAFVAAMNVKARELGMLNTHFSDPTGLSSENVSTAYDLARMVRAASEYAQIREFTTTPSHYVELQPTGQLLGFNNTNSLVKSSDWDISVSKTGFIREAGKCLVMLATIASRPVIIVLLDSYGRLTRVGDAMRVKHWLETGQSLQPQVATRSASKPRRVSGKLMPTRART
jgi:D-alanyl-D-alanine endopeptidase (penicillin-binding protein 7)